MAVIIQRYLACDHPGCTSVYGINRKHETSPVHREKAKNEGWTYTAMGEDFCPQHKPKQKQQ